MLAILILFLHLQEASQEASAMATAQRVKSVVKTVTPFDPRHAPFLA